MSPDDAVPPLLSLADVPWRFDSGAGPRLHLQSAISSHRVWLERDGHRAFEPEPALDVGAFGSLEIVVSRPEIRAAIEQGWIANMMREGWLELVDALVSDLEQARRCNRRTPSITPGARAATVSRGAPA